MALSPRGLLSQGAASQVADTQPDQTDGEKVSVLGRTGTLAWDGRPAHGYVKVLWDDNGTKSQCIKIEEVTFLAQVPTAADGDVSPGIEVKKTGAPWNQKEEPVWKAEDFPDLNPAGQTSEQFPSLDRSKTPRRSLSRNRSANALEGNRTSQGTPRRARIGSISEGKPQVQGCIPEDKPQNFRGRGIPEDKMPMHRGYLQQSCPSLQPQQQRQQPQLGSAWQQRQSHQRTAKSVEPEQKPRATPRAASETRQPATAQPKSLTRQPIGYRRTEELPQEVGSGASKDHPAASSGAFQQTMPPGNFTSSESRCQSEPVKPAVSKESLEAASAQAAKIGQVHGDMRLTLHSMLQVADQVKAAGCLDPTLLASFADGHGKMMKLMKPLQAEGATTQDTSALLALNLLLVAAQVKASGCTNATAGMAPTSEHAKPVGFQMDPDSARRARFLPTPARSHSFVPVFMPQMQAAQGGVMPMAPNMWMPQGVARAPWVNDFHAPSAEPLRAKPRPRRKYTVINPSTSEKMTIRCSVPFRWQPKGACRLRIIDPKTGAEVLPYSSKPMSDEARRASTASSRMSMMSNGTRCSTGSEPRRRSVTPSAPRQRHRSSVAGTAIHDGTTWALEPASGGFWDFPLSRQEKKDRVMMLGQLELLEEIEELKDELKWAAASCAEPEFEIAN